MITRQSILFFLIGLNISLLYLYLNNNNIVIKKEKKNKCIY